MFELVGILKGLNPGAEPEALRGEFDLWYEQAELYIRTKDREFNWQEFCRGGKCRKFPATIARATASAQKSPPILPDMPKLDALGRLRRALGNNPPGEFFLTTRAACKHCGFATPMEALRAFQRLAASGLIALVQRGTPGVVAGGKANRYRWIRPPNVIAPPPAAGRAGSATTDWAKPEANAQTAGL